MQILDAEQRHNISVHMQCKSITYIFKHFSEEFLFIVCQQNLILYSRCDWQVLMWLDQHMGFLVFIRHLLTFLTKIIVQNQAEKYSSTPVMTQIQELDTYETFFYLRINTRQYFQIFIEILRKGSIRGCKQLNPDKSALHQYAVNQSTHGE